MITAAVCDDDAGMAALAEKKVRDICVKNSVPAQTAMYHSGLNLLADTEEDGRAFDLALLDIEMPEIDGMHLAAALKKKLPACLIILLTSHMEYILDAFALEVFRYVPKQDTTGRLEAAVEDALKMLELQHDRFYVCSGKHMEKIPLRAITHIVRDGRNAVLYTDSGESRVRKSLQTVHDELGTEEFIFTDRGCIVNLLHVARLQGDEALLTNGRTIPVSRGRRQDVKEALCRYWSENL